MSKVNRRFIPSLLTSSLESKCLLSDIPIAQISPDAPLPGEAPLTPIDPYAPTPTSSIQPIDPSKEPSLDPPLILPVPPLIPTVMDSIQTTIDGFITPPPTPLSDATNIPNNPMSPIMLGPDVEPTDNPLQSPAITSLGTTIINKIVVQTIDYATADWYSYLGFDQSPIK